MEKRTAFPKVFWVANLVEVLERYAYYGIYIGFGVYMQHLGHSKAELGIIQTIFLLLSYTIPLFSGTFADKYGFKKMLIVSYLCYLPTILLLIVTKSFSGIALTMLSIGFAAGMFKPLIAATVRSTTDSSNKTLGFGIFYAMVNLGATIGPLVAGKLSVISWNYAFLSSAIAIAVMFVLTLLFYKEPKREIEGVTLKQKFQDIGIALSDPKFLTLLILLGVFFWIPFWAFFNLCALFVENNVDTAQLFFSVKSVTGTWFAQFISASDEQGIWRVIGMTIAHDGYIIIFLQVPISWFIARFRAIPVFNSGLFISAVGFVVIAASAFSSPALIFLGILLFAIGEMISSPRIQEYILWTAPKEKAGLYMGAVFLSTAIGAFSGMIYTPLYGYFHDAGNGHYVWYVLAAHYLLAIVAMTIFTKVTGGYKERQE